MSVLLCDPDGNELMRMSGQIKVPDIAGGKVPQVNVILELKDIVFPKPGTYQFVVHVDKDYKGDIPIYVDQAQPAQ
jgi:hypothetical protein